MWPTFRLLHMLGLIRMAYLVDANALLHAPATGIAILLPSFSGWRTETGERADPQWKCGRITHKYTHTEPIKRVVNGAGAGEIVMNALNTHRDKVIDRALTTLYTQKPGAHTSLITIRKCLFNTITRLAACRGPCGAPRRRPRRGVRYNYLSALFTQHRK